MIFNFKKKPDIDELKKQAQADFEKALELKEDKARSSKQYCTRIALQSRTHIDKLFVEAAKKTEDFEAVAMEAIAAGESIPEKPTASPYLSIKSNDGLIYSYIPEKFANQVFAIAAAYQTVKIGRAGAIEQAQRTADTLFEEIGVSQSFNVLQFLRDEEELDKNNGTESDISGSDKDTETE
jgi:hypothetical protein